MKQETLQNDIITVGYAKGYADCLSAINKTMNVAMQKRNTCTHEGTVELINDIIHSLYIREEELQHLNNVLDEQMQESEDAFDDLPEDTTVKIKHCHGKDITVIIGGK
jgi:hypothetical protein